MRKLTKGDVLKAAVLVAALLAVTIGASPIAGSEAWVSHFWLLGLVAAAFFAVEVILDLFTKRRAGTLDEPVSDGASNAIKNIVSIAWLLVVAILFAMLIQDHGRAFALIALAPVIAALVGGRLLQRKLGSTSLLPYSFTYLLALVAAFAIEHLGGWR